MSSGNPQRPDREGEQTSRAREVERGGPGGSRDTLHPAPPAEGKWRGILGQVRGLIRRGRGKRRPS